MPLDIALFRTYLGADVNVLRESQRRRFERVELIDEIIALDEEFRKIEHESSELGAQFNTLGQQMKAAQIAKRKNGGDKAQIEKDIAEIGKKMGEMKQKRETLKKDAAAALEKRNAKLNLVGNLVHESVPVSMNEEKDNRVERTIGEPRQIENPLHHHEILHMLDGYDQLRAVKVSGHRAYFLRGVGVMLNQALINYALDFLSKREYTALQTPFFMKKSVMGKTCQLGGAEDREFDDDMYTLPGDKPENDLILIATSEQPISAFHAEETLLPPQLPIKYAGYSTNFRKEAGAHGRETWGVFRVHQFEKIEQFVITAPGQASWDMLEQMMQTSEEFYQSLGLAYRVVSIVSKELNSATAKKYDLEAWFPGYEGYRELVSASNCTDYQARAMEIKYGGGGNDRTQSHVHMLNGTLCATERTMCCLLENYQREDGFEVPAVLRPYLGGKEFFPFVCEKPAHTAGAAQVAKKKKGKEKQQKAK